MGKIIWQGNNGKNFDKTIIDIWIDPDTFNKFVVSVDDKGVLFLTEIFPEVIK